MSFRIRAQVHGIRYGDGVLVAIHQRQLHLVPYKGDVAVMTLGVLHVMVHLATVEQRGDHKRGRGGESPRRPVMVVCGLPCAISRREQNMGAPDPARQP